MVPAGGDKMLKRAGSDFRHGNDAHGKRGNRENAELNDLGDDHAEHAALDDVNGGDRNQNGGVLVRGQVPGQEYRSELSNPFETVTEEPDDAHEGVDDHDQMGKLRATAAAESCLDPLRAGHHVRAAQPR